MIDYLLLSPAAHLVGNSIRMRTAEGELRLNAPRKLLERLVVYASEQVPLDRWLDELGTRWSRKQLDALLTELIEREFLVPRNNLPQAIWQYVANLHQLSEPVTQVSEDVLGHSILPPVSDSPEAVQFSYTSTPASELLGRQQIEHRFGLQNVPTQDVFQLLFAAYGKLSEDVFQPACSAPSGGAVYPLDIHLLNLQRTPELARGVYGVSYSADRSVSLFAKNGEIEQIARAYDDPSLLENAQAVIVIAGVFSRSAETHGPRALFYVALEAGRVAQNILLRGQSLNLAMIEVGGFNETRVREIAHLDKGSVPLTTIILGAKSEKIELVSSAKCTFEWLELESPGYAPDFHTGRARIGSGEWAWGRDPNAHRAWLKTVMEAHERYACGAPSDLQLATIDDWSDAIDPQSLAIYTADQYRSPCFPFAPFDRRQAYYWKQGKDVATGLHIWVPSDFVFYSSALPEMPRLTATTSSGVAAHTNAARALENAVLEVLERDILMRAWLRGGTLPKISLASLPTREQHRILALKRAEIDVCVRALDQDGVTTCMVAAQSKKLRFTRVGSGISCAPETALNHALMELESAVAASISFNPGPVILTSDVATVEDHARFYSRPRQFRSADWYLFADASEEDFRRLGRNNEASAKAVVNRLLERDERIVSVLLAEGNAKVIRAIIPGRIPMWFGYNREPRAMVDVSITRPQRGHPHPFI